MPKLLLNQKPIVKQVIPSLDEGINKLNEAIHQLNDIRIDGSNPCYNSMVSLADALRKIFIDLTKEKERLNYIPVLINEMEEQKKLLATLPVVEIVKRDRLI